MKAYRNEKLCYMNQLQIRTDDIEIVIKTKDMSEIQWTNICALFRKLRRTLEGKDYDIPFEWKRQNL